MSGKKLAEASDAGELATLWRMFAHRMDSDSPLDDTPRLDIATAVSTWMSAKTHFHYRSALAALAATQAGWLGEGTTKDSRVAGRVPHQLLEAAKARSGLTSTTELLEYALAKVALEDDFGQFLLSQEGTVDPNMDLEF